jgi:hypothetical protein
MRPKPETRIRSTPKLTWIFIAFRGRILTR